MRFKNSSGFISIATLGAWPLTVAARPSSDLFVQLFLQTCVSSYSQPQQVSQQAKRMGLKEITGDRSTGYLRGIKGRVWAGKYKAGIYAISLLHDGTCSVLVNSGDPQKLRAAVESWLPPKGSGVSVSKNNLSTRQGGHTYSYALQEGNVHEEWILTTYNIDQPSRWRAIVSYKPNHSSKRTR